MNLVKLYLDVLNSKQLLWNRSYRNSNEDLLSIHDKEKGLLEKDKKRGDIEINDLKKALHDKEKEIGSINEECKR